MISWAWNRALLLIDAAVSDFGLNYCVSLSSGPRRANICHPSISTPCIPAPYTPNRVAARPQSQRRRPPYPPLNLPITTLYSLRPSHHHVIHFILLFHQHCVPSVHLASHEKRPFPSLSFLSLTKTEIYGKPRPRKPCAPGVQWANCQRPPQ